MNLFDELQGYLSGQFNSIKTVISLIRLEAKLAGLTVIPLVINLFLLLIVSTTIWVALMCLIGYGAFILLYHNYWLTIGSILLINLLILGGLLKYLSFNIKLISFEKTRAYFNQPERTHHEQLEKRPDSSKK